MRALLILLFLMLGSFGALAQGTDCRPIGDALLRLHCYETTVFNAAPRGIVRSVLENPAALVALFASLLAFVSAILGPTVQLLIGKRQAAVARISADAAMLSARNAGYREIAKMRLEWVSTLRDTLSEYHSLLMSLDEQEEEKQAQKLSELGTQIDLLLNKDDPAQRRLWDVTDKIFNTEDLRTRQSMDQDLIEAGRVVMKAEWEKIKREMLTGVFQTGEAK